jgi:hypothetical protein
MAALVGEVGLRASRAETPWRCLAPDRTRHGLLDGIAG